MKNSFIFHYGTAFFSLLIMIVICGCKTTYDQLPYMPEYPELQQTFDTSATIEFAPLKDKNIDKKFTDKLRECKYNNVICGSHYLKNVPDNVKILDIISFKNTDYNCQDGKYVDTRILVMVRENGVVWNNQLRYAPARYFQAFSQAKITSDENEIIQKIRMDNANNAVDNLFKISEFRQALEPKKKNIAIKFSNDVAGYWAKSKYYQAAENENLLEAARFALMAAEKGSVDAANYLADNALYTSIFGRNADFQRFVEKMANAGNANAQNRLGLMFLNGEIVQQNYYLAYHWFKKAADNGSAAGLYNVGHCYEYGRGVEKNIDEAFLWYRKSADKGFSSAIVKLRRHKKM